VGNNPYFTDPSSVPFEVPVYSPKPDYKDQATMAQIDYLQRLGADFVDITYYQATEWLSKRQASKAIDAAKKGRKVVVLGPVPARVIPEEIVEEHSGDSPQDEDAWGSPFVSPFHPPVVFPFLPLA